MSKVCRHGTVITAKDKCDKCFQEDVLGECNCSYKRDAGKCYAEKYGLEYPFADFVDLWCECFCHLPKK